MMMAGPTTPQPPLTSHRIIAAGFVLVLVLFSLILAIGYTQLRDSRQRLSAIVDYHNTKVDLLFSMRNLVRERSLSMYAMYFKRDPFDREDEFMRFTGMSTDFIVLRERLERMGLDKEERALLNQAFDLIRRSQPLQVELVERIAHGQTRGIENRILKEDLPLEESILAIFDQLVELERSRAQAVASESVNASNHAVLLLQVIAPLIVLVGIGIAVVVMRHTRRTEDALQQQKEQAEVTLHSIADAVITTDAMGHVTYVNPVAEQLTGWRLDDARDHQLAEVYRVVHETSHMPANHPAFRHGLDGPTVGLERYWLLVARNGDEYTIEDSVAPIRDRHGHITGQVLIFRDVTRARELARQLTWQAHHDALTGLPNRHTFELTLRRLLDSARHYGHEHALLYIDLDQFKVVNDTCGHAAGDELLRQLALIFKAQIRHSDALARLGGDEFGVLLESCSLDQARRIADQLRTATEDYRFVRDDKVFRVLASIGLVHIDANSEGLQHILSAADAACYMAKEKGRNRIWVHQADDAELSQRHGEMHQISNITRALEEDRFVLYRQIIQPLAPGHGRTTHCEILMRLVDEEARVQAPLAVIPAAERYGMMAAVDRWVIRRTFESLARGQIPHVDAISINVSSQSLGDDHFLEYVLAQLAVTNADPRRCMFEITETAAIANWTRALQFVATLKKLGCRFALDDFGAGMSSFAYLQSLPVDMIKIDGRFVRNIAHNPTDRAMVEAIHHVAHVMGIATIAESVEDSEALAVVKTLGIDYAQGFIIHRPEPLSTPDRVSVRA